MANGLEDNSILKKAKGQKQLEDLETTAGITPGESTPEDLEGAGQIIAGTQMAADQGLDIASTPPNQLKSLAAGQPIQAVDPAAERRQARLAQAIIGLGATLAGAAFGGAAGGAAGAKAAGRGEQILGKELQIEEQAEFAQTAQKSKAANDLRKERSNQSTTKTSQEMVGAYGRILASARLVSPAGDLAIIFNYMKLLDPRSVVRESEFRTAASTGSLPERIQAAYNKAISGEILTDVIRNDFVSKAKALFDQQMTIQKDFDVQFEKIADASGIDRRLVFIQAKAPASFTTDFATIVGREVKKADPSEDQKGLGRFSQALSKIRGGISSFFGGGKKQPKQPQQQQQPAFNRATRQKELEKLTPKQLQGLTP